MEENCLANKNTIYLSNLPFSLTNNDLYKILEVHGKITKVTIMKNRTTRKSTGVAFVIFEKSQDGHQCIKALNGVEMFGRTLKASIAKDNGRTTEFSKKKQIVDKSRCYECGEFGHLSYKCPGNVLGDRPLKIKYKKKYTGKRKFPTDKDDDKIESDESEDDQKRIVLENQDTYIKPKPKYKKNSYLSDDEDLEDDY